MALAMVIDVMRTQDLDDVRRLASQLGYDCASYEIASRFAAIHNSAAHQLFVARNAEGGRAVGWIHVTIETLSLLGEPRADVSALVVDEACRGSGVGRALLAAAEDWAREQGLSLVRIRTNTKRERAHRFYEKSGYSLLKSWHLFVKDV